MNPRLVVAGGALGLGAVLGVPHGHQREGLHAPGAAEGHVHRGYAVTARGDAEPHGTQADVGGFQKDVLHGGAELERGEVDETAYADWKASF